MKCQKCGNEVANGFACCPMCGTPVAGVVIQGAPGVEISTKSRTTYALLGFFLGNLGVHDFYAGNIGRGIVNILGNVIISPFLVQISTGIELLTTKKDSKGKIMQGSDALAIILGIILIIINLIAAIIVGIAIAAGAAASH